MNQRSFKRLCYGIFAASFGAATITAFILLTLYFQQPRINDYLNSSLKTELQKRLPPDLLIKVIQLNWSWKGLYRLEPFTLLLEIENPSLQLTSRGPLSWSLPAAWTFWAKREAQKTIELEYQSQLLIRLKPISVEGEDANLEDQPKPSANSQPLLSQAANNSYSFDLDLKAGFDPNESRLTKSQISFTANELSFKNLQLRSMALELKADFTSKSKVAEFEIPEIDARLKIDQINYQNAELQVEVGQLDLRSSLKNCDFFLDFQSPFIRAAHKELRAEVARQSLQLFSQNVCEDKTRFDLAFDLKAVQAQQSELNLAVEQLKLIAEAVIRLPRFLSAKRPLEEQNHHHHHDHSQEQDQNFLVNAGVKVKGLEILKGDFYFSPPIENQQVVLSLKGDLKPEQAHPRLSDFSIKMVQSKQKVSIQQDGVSWLQLQASSKNLISKSDPMRFTFKLRQQLSVIRDLLPPQDFSGWQFDSEIDAQVEATKNAEKWGLIAPSFIELKQFKLVHAELKHQSSFNLRADLLSQTKAQIEIFAPEIKQLNLQAKILKWVMPIKVEPSKVRVLPTVVPLTVKGLQLQFEPLAGYVSWQDGLVYEFSTGLQLYPVSLKKLAQKLCLSPDITPDGFLQLSYPKLNLTQNQVTSQGHGNLQVFGGKIEIDQFEINDFLSSAPKTKLSANWSGLDLNLIGDFTQFGGMVGLVEGHLNDLSFEGTLLRDYDFLFRLKPIPNNRKFYFSKVATNNLIRIFSRGQGLDRGASGLLLDLSSQVLGDYGVSYAGLRARTQNNFVILETFDPDEVVEREGSHFLLYGARIKMPLSTKTYPIILSQTGWNGFVYYFKDSLLALMDKQETKEETVCSPEPN